MASLSVCLPQKLKQDIARQKSCLEATREMVTRFLETADSPTASALQAKLAEVTERFGRLCRQQRDREDALKSLLPKVEQYEQLSEKLQQFTESRARVLASGNRPDQDIAHFSQHIQVRCRRRRLHLCLRFLGRGCFAVICPWTNSPRVAPGLAGSAGPVLALCLGKGVQLEQRGLFPSVREGNGISPGPGWFSEEISSQALRGRSKYSQVLQIKDSTGLIRQHTRALAASAVQDVTKPSEMPWAPVTAVPGFPALVSYRAGGLATTSAMV